MNLEVAPYLRREHENRTAEAQRSQCVAGVSTPLATTGNPSNAVAPRCSKWRDTEKEIKRERSPFEVRIDERSLLKFKLQLLCRIHLV
ncbi:MULTISPECIES: hypothetical protein [unclassified Nostoc]|uniref:hypothetical protein n=1 Tax=unclassified Nostoc TaxID=2593658 RepID=UPI002634E41E|nr:hypothetical protein [Nostoc sp. S13]MDF5734485.1 hypothetical protein [Nostoc sp. S13]